MKCQNVAAKCVTDGYTVGVKEKVANLELCVTVVSIVLSHITLFASP